MKQPLALFPGMASARPGLGAALTPFPAARRAVDRFSAASGVDIERLLTAAPAAELFADRAWELAVVAAEVAAAAAHLEAGGKIGGALGFSIGAYAALEVAGSITVEQVVAMIDAVLDASRELAGPFMMVGVVGVPAGGLAPLCRPGEAELAATMSDSQHLVAGRVEAVRELAAAVGPAALRITEVPVRWPLHTSLMAPVAARLEAARPRVGAIRPPAMAVYSALHGRAIDGAEEAWDLLVGHLWRPQRFDQALTAALAAGFRRLVELGPGATLTGAARWTARDAVEPVGPAFGPAPPPRQRRAC